MCNWTAFTDKPRISRIFGEIDPASNEQIDRHIIGRGLKAERQLRKNPRARVGNNFTKQTFGVALVSRGAFKTRDDFNVKTIAELVERRHRGELVTAVHQNACVARKCGPVA